MGFTLTVKLTCTLLVFAQANGQCFMPPIVFHKEKEYSQDIHFNIPLDSIFHYTQSSYMDRDGCIKFTTQLSTVCGASTINNQILFFDEHHRRFYDHALSYMDGRYIQPSVLKAGDFGNDRPNDNGPNAILKSLYNGAKESCMLNYGTTKKLSHHMKSILVEAWDAFKVSTGNIVRDIFVKTKILPLSTPKFSTNTQACVASVQVSSGAKVEDINIIANHTIGSIEVQEIKTDNPMVFLQERGIWKSSGNIVLQSAVYDAARQRTIVPFQEMKK